MQLFFFSNEENWKERNTLDAKNEAGQDCKKDPNPERRRRATRKWPDERECVRKERKRKREREIEYVRKERDKKCRKDCDGLENGHEDWEEKIKCENRMIEWLKTNYEEKDTYNKQL